MRPHYRQRTSRRDFLKLSGAAGLSVLLSGCLGEDTRSIELPNLNAASPNEQALGTDLPIEERLDAIIVGAGAAGLTAAYFLRNFNIRVLETETRPGGRVISGEYQGFTYAQGAEYLDQPYGALRRILKELDLQPVQIPAPGDARFYKDQFFFGEQGLALMFIHHASLLEYNRFMAVIQEYTISYNDIPNFDLKSDLATLDVVSAKEWFEKQKLPEVFLDAYNVSARGLFGANLDEISALSYIPEIAYDFAGASPILSANNLVNSPEASQQETGMYTFVTGLTEVTDGMAKVLPGRVRFGAQVTNVIRRGQAYLVSYTDRDGNKHTLASKVVILATPAPVTLEIAPLVLSEEQQRILSQVSYAPYLTVALFSDQPIFNQAFDLSVPDGWFFTDLYDSTWVQRHYDVTMRQNATSILGAYCPPNSFEDQTLLQLSDEQVIQRVTRDLEKVFPGASRQILDARIQRFPYAYPVMTSGAYRRLTRLHRINKGSLLLAGDYLIYPTFEAAVESGFMAAQKAMARLQ